MTWIVNIIGSETGPQFEIAVVRQDNTQGLDMYGWPDENKYITSCSGLFSDVHMIPIVWEMMIDLSSLIRTVESLYRCQENIFRNAYTATL